MKILSKLKSWIDNFCKEERWVFQSPHPNQFKSHLAYFSGGGRYCYAPAHRGLIVKWNGKLDSDCIVVIYKNPKQMGIWEKQSVILHGEAAEEYKDAITNFGFNEMARCFGAAEKQAKRIYELYKKDKSYSKALYSS